MDAVQQRCATVAQAIGKATGLVRVLSVLSRFNCRHSCLEGPFPPAVAVGLRVVPEKPGNHSKLCLLFSALSNLHSVFLSSALQLQHFVNVLLSLSACT